MLYVILIEPEIQGNIGAIARAMKNFALKNLILINPKCNHLNNESKRRAKHAQDILKKTKVKPFSYLKQFDYLIGTTAKIGRDYNIPRIPITPEQLSQKLSTIKNKSKKNQKIAIVFGREGPGLTNQEILMCDFIVSIPSSKKYFTLNISHAASIIFYELFKKQKTTTISHITPISKKDKQQILKMMNQVLNKLPFATKEKKTNTKNSMEKSH